MMKEQSNFKDMKQQKEPLLTKNKMKKQGDQKVDIVVDIHDQIMGLFKSYREQDVLVCFKDKKTKQLKFFSSDPTVLSLDQIKISKKTENLQKFELTELVTRLKHVPKTEDDSAQPKLKDQSTVKQTKGRETAQIQKPKEEKSEEKLTD